MLGLGLGHSTTISVSLTIINIDRLAHWGNKRRNDPLDHVSDAASATVSAMPSARAIAEVMAGVSDASMLP